MANAAFYYGPVWQEHKATLNGLMTGQTRILIVDDEQDIVEVLEKILEDEAKYEVEVAKGGEGVKGTLTGTLTLGGTQKTITVEATGRDASGSLRVAGVHEIKLSEYGLKAPTLMFGTMKVGDAVKVNFDLLLTAAPKVATTD